MYQQVTEGRRRYVVSREQVLQPGGKASHPQAKLALGSSEEPATGLLGSFNETRLAKATMR